jgi:pimeloyl-ACP methyl ester carboxylesterase
VNGAFGDSLSRRGNRLALPMTLRRDGADVDPGRLADAYPDATSRLVVFVHGLGQTEDAWRWRAGERAPYGFRLREDLGYTELYVRYNSGRHISENGYDLAELLESVVSGWPCEVSAIALIGHSVGGLVARSASHFGGGRAWAGRLRQVVTLGSPHGGAPLEKAAAWIGGALDRLPETRAGARALALRSAGFKDAGPASAIPFLPAAKYYFVAGGGLVPRASAWAQSGRREPVQFPVDHYREVRGVSHFELLNHPAVYELLREWLGPARPELPAPRPSLPAGQRP